MLAWRHIPSVENSIANRSLASQDLQEGLEGATESAYPEVVAALFKVGATIMQDAVDSLSDESNHLVIRHYLDHCLDPNARDRNGEPLLIYVTYHTILWQLAILVSKLNTAE